ncbi:MAG: hypothetical protein XXXJIFNMEKO3_02577 [Candidatus Erwinia impunctatus]
MSEFLLHISCLIGIYAIVALALNILAGYASLLNFGHIVFMGTGAYAIGLGGQFFLPSWVVIPVGILFAAMISLIMTLLGCQLTADYRGIGGLTPPWSTVDISSDTLIFAIIVLAGVIIAAWGCAHIGNSRFGRALKLRREQLKLACVWAMISPG